MHAAIVHTCIYEYSSTATVWYYYYQFLVLYSRRCLKTFAFVDTFSTHTYVARARSVHGPSGSYSAVDPDLKSTYCFYAHMHEIMKLNRSKSVCRIHWDGLTRRRSIEIPLTAVGKLAL